VLSSPQSYQWWRLWVSKHDMEGLKIQARR
jgi:hypothetical protein